MSRCPGCDNRIHCRLCDGGDDPVKVAEAEGFHRGTKEASAALIEMQDLLHAVLRCEDVHTDRKWMRRAKAAAGNS
jgi:hypothetical protein